MKKRGRYAKVERTVKSGADDPWYAPAMYSDKRAAECYAAITSVDTVARELEQKWGIGKLEALATPQLAVEFAQARANFNEAANGDDVKYLVQKANNMIAGLKALEQQAISRGHKPSDAEAWYAVAPPDVGEYAFAIVRDASDAVAVDREVYPRVYTLDEVARIISHYETSMLKKAKEVFPNSQITKIGSNDKKDDPNDPIPF